MNNGNESSNNNLILTLFYDLDVKKLVLVHIS